MKLPVTIQLPELWSDQEFHKDEWGGINFLVGPNGTGKTRFGSHLNAICSEKLRTRYLQSDRIRGIREGFGIGEIERIKQESRHNGVSGDVVAVLKQKPDIRIRIEATLSKFFNRTLKLEEDGGNIVPKVINKQTKVEYPFGPKESHGLREIISLLTFLHDEDHNCYIIDEPELHLHPQYQTLLLQEMRRLAGDPITESNKKCFFLITHSPYMIDVRTSDELRHCVIFHTDTPPSYANPSADDEFRLRRLLPRLNTHHKQFFFATRPLFVEGYTDQQLFTLIQEKRSRMLGASGACIVDVGGKEEQDLFFRLCQQLNINGYFVSDLDALFEGQLRQSVSADKRCRDFIQKEGLGSDLMKFIGEMEKEITHCVGEVTNMMANCQSATPAMLAFSQALIAASKKKEGEKVQRIVFLIGLQSSIAPDIESCLAQKKDSLNSIRGKLKKVAEVFRQSGVYILVKGELEHYLPSYKGDPYAISDQQKANSFEAERAFLLDDSHTENQILARYGDLPGILDGALDISPLDMERNLLLEIYAWIQKVQLAFERGEIRDKESLLSNTLVNWNAYARIFDQDVSFSLDGNGFVCKVKLKPFMDSKERTFIFSRAPITREVRFE